MVEYAAVPAHQRDIVSCHLTIPSVSSELNDCLGQWRHSPHVIAGELAAASVQLQRTFWAYSSARDERSTLPFPQNP
jgi:hypothetical protein